MVKDRIEPYGYCQKCGKYKPRVRKRHINMKKQKLEKIRKEERD